MTVKRPRERVTPFLRGRVWWARVPRLDAAPIQRSMGVVGKENEDVARQVCDFLRWLRSRRESYLLDAIATGKAPIGAAYTAYIEGTLPRFITELREGIVDLNLEPWVAKWVKEMERRKKPGAAVRAIYLRQVRQMIPDGAPFKRSGFTRQAIRDFLSGLRGVSQTNRHRAALSSFAGYLMFEDVLTVNVVKQVPMAKEAEPRTLHLTVEEAKRLVEALPAPYKGLHALMLATGMEYAAAVAVRAQDVGDRQVYAAGTKRAHRRRTVGVYDRWFWAWDIAVSEIADALPLDFHGLMLPFRGMNRWASHAALKRALAVAGLPKEYTTHDHRHTWAVQAIRDRLPLPMIAHNLGHRDSAMLLKVYGRYAPTGADFSRITSIGATVPRIQAENSTDSEGL